MLLLYRPSKAELLFQVLAVPCVGIVAIAVTADIVAIVIIAVIADIIAIAVIVVIVLAATADVVCSSCIRCELSRKINIVMLLNKCPFVAVVVRIRRTMITMITTGNRQ